MNAGAAVAAGAALLAAGCGAGPRVICNAAIAQPSLLVDLRAFAAGHHEITGVLCPQVAGDPALSQPCASFSLTDAGLLATANRLVQQGPRVNVLRLYLTPGENRLVVHLQAQGVPAAGGEVKLTGHREPGPCAGFDYSTVVISANGTPSTS